MWYVKELTEEKNRQTVRCGKKWNNLLELLLSFVQIELKQCVEFWINETFTDVAWCDIQNSSCVHCNAIRWRWKMTMKFIFYLYSLKQREKRNEVYICFCCINLRTNTMQYGDAIAAAVVIIARFQLAYGSQCALYHRSQVVWICINIISFGGNICSFSLS